MEPIDGIADYHSTGTHQEELDKVRLQVICVSYMLVAMVILNTQHTDSAHDDAKMTALRGRTAIPRSHMFLHMAPLCRTC